MPINDSPPRTRVLETQISRTSYDEVCRLLVDWARNDMQGYVAVCNVHTVMEAHRDPAYREVLNGARIATPDGMPLVWALRRLGYPTQQRVYGPDLLLAFADYAAREARDCASYFYGAGSGVAERLAGVLQERFPGFPVAGWESPPYGEMSEVEAEAAIQRINESGARICWVGLGAPRQEFWMHRHADRVRPVMVGIGAAFDFHTGQVRQAPRWMMRLGFEWLFRLAVEPRRLWRRYLIYNPLFVLAFTRQLLGRRDRGSDDA